MKFYHKKELSGPHNLEVLCVLFGGLLGDMYGETRVYKSRFHFKQSSRNQEYLHWIHTFLSLRGYCSYQKPTKKKIIGKDNKVYYVLRGRTYSFASLNWLIDCFYSTGTKRIPNDDICEIFLTPLALAIWISDDGTACPKAGVLIATDCFCRSDLLRVVDLIKRKYGIQMNLRFRSNREDGTSAFNLYIPRSELSYLQEIVKPHMCSSMHYKLHL